jgi:hypothetical protein
LSPGRPILPLIFLARVSLITDADKMSQIHNHCAMFQ